MRHRFATRNALALLLALGATGAFAATAAAPLGSTPSEETADQWRASKLAGVPIYGPDNKSIGKITDVLLSREGKAAYVVIGVGGFLGIGEKDVAVPYDQVNFVQQPVERPAMTAEPTNNLATAGTDAAALSTAPGATGPSATRLGTPAATPGIPTAPAMAGATGTPAAPMPMAAPPPISMAYPDHGVIALTADQLKQAPSFRFAK